MRQIVDIRIKARQSIDIESVTNRQISDSETIIVFGATGGIGSSLCRRLASRGTRLIIAGRSTGDLHVQGASLPGSIAVIADATVQSDVDAVLERAVREFGRVDGVVNCVGSLLLKPAHLTTTDDWESVIRTNLTSSFNIVRAAVRIMMRQEAGGSIILISSAAAQLGIANHEAIAAAKAGIIGLARSAAATYARQNIRVNCVAPGLTDTALTAGITRNPNSLAASVAMHALGRIAAPVDIASAIAWLVDPENSFVSGQVIAVDGGLSSLQPRPTMSPTSSRV